MNNFNEKTPSEAYNLPVIGRIKCFLDLIMIDQYTKEETRIKDSSTYDVIKIVPLENGGEVYWCNCWNSPGKVQSVHSAQDESFEKY